MEPRSPGQRFVHPPDLRRSIRILRRRKHHRVRAKRLLAEALTYTDQARLRVSLEQATQRVAGASSGTITSAGLSAIWQVAPSIALRAWTMHVTDTVPAYALTTAYDGSTTPTVNAFWLTYDATPGGLRLDAITVETCSTEDRSITSTATSRDPSPTGFAGTPASKTGNAERFSTWVYVSAVANPAPASRRVTRRLVRADACAVASVERQGARRRRPQRHRRP